MIEQMFEKRDLEFKELDTFLSVLGEEAKKGP
jgi:hypothetical protein